LADIFTKEERSKIMAGISGKETKPEILVRKFLFSKGFRYRKNVKDLPGKPDIVLPKFRTVIFVHGCFWHGHYQCKRASIPRSNNLFWDIKIKKNKERDKRNCLQLKRMGWHVITIWQCELKNQKIFTSTLDNLIRTLNST
jgi:DNA mismatch endonuclease, patch repair protein